MPTFPDLDYSESGYSYEVAPAVLRTESTSRTSRQRKLYKKRDDIFSVSLRLDNADLLTFENFVLDDITNGADLFTAPYYDGDVERTSDAYMVGGQYSVSYVAPDIWDVSYSLEIKDRDMTDAENVYLVVNEYSGFDTMGNILDALESMINDNNL